MSDKTKPCQQCGGVMAYRLGEYQCGQCGFTQPAPVAGGAMPRSAPPPPREAWRREQDAGPGAGTVFTPGGYSARGVIDSGGSAKYDPAPTLNYEKQLFFGVFLLRALLSICVAGMARPDAAAQQLSAMGGFAEGPGGRLITEAVSLALLGLVLYVPAVPVKWCCATYSCFQGVLGLVGLFLGALFMPIVGLLAPGVGGGGLLGFLGLLAGILQVAVYLWFASILYRDIQKLQIG